MLKIDRPILEEFLGTTVLEREIITKLKCCRLYGRKGDSVNDNIIILTPMLRENGEYIKAIENAQKMAGHPVEITEHKRGNNYVYTFKEKILGK